MRMNELVALYEATRRRAADLRSWRLRLLAWRVRRALRRDPTNEAHQVRLVAVEHALVRRGVLARPTFPSRAPAPGPRRVPWWRRWGRR
jgi:hypothetical protein